MINGSLKGTITLTAGLGGMGGAQTLAVTMNEGVNITVEANFAFTSNIPEDVPFSR